MSIRNIYCVGRNYGLHAAELNNEVPESPMIFMKPSHSVFLMDGRVLFLPEQFGSLHYEAEVVVRIGRYYEAGIGMKDLLKDFALGLDLTLRDLQSELKKQQYPWLKAKGFLRSAPLTEFRPIPLGEGLINTFFSLKVNGEERQRGRLSEAIFDLPALCDHIGTHYGLGDGDVIFTGTPAGVGRLIEKDQLELFWDEERLGYCQVAFQSI